MAKFNVTSPDGQKFVITAPDDATPEQVMSYAQSQWKAPEPKYDPTEGMGTIEKVRAGIGMGMAKTARAVGQAVGLVDQSEIDEANRLDQALANTKAGKFGGFVGTTAAVAPALLIPGANTYAGAALIGAGTGALTTEGDIGDRAQGALFGGLGGLAGKGLGDAAGAGINKLRTAYAGSQAAKQTANAGRDSAVQLARQSGYNLPPTEVRPNALNSLLEGLSGKTKTSQAASQQNQEVTNALAKKAVGLADDAVLDGPALQAIRAEAGKAYDAVAAAGQITPGAKYTQALDSIVSDAQKAAQSFPNGKANPVLAEIDALRSASFDAGSAVAKIKELRAAADTAYAQRDKSLGKALKQGAAALEDAIEDHLQQAGPGLLKQFRDARQLIAKTYSVESALNKGSGEVAASALAKQLQKGRPLSGELRTIAEVGSAFPKATQVLPQSYNALSPLDFAVAAGTGDLTGLVARPGARSLILSRPYQALAARPMSYDDSATINALARLLGNNQLRSLLPAAAAAQSVPAE